MFLKKKRLNKGVTIIYVMFKILNIKSLRFIYIFNKFGFRIGVFQPKHIFSCTKMDQSGPKWIKMDRNSPNKLNQTKWNKVDQMKRMGTNGLNRTVGDPIGLKQTE